ncbi:glutamate ABC transporter substrate-binding protein [Streptomyces sp. Je 1-79]|uniref:glutamate ABC transporter substrate-binding protein n=1 Tax=Streptomyces sp. Je 1-79 TaxID=2943847 RepID=UPI0021A6FEEB|nr:glutamate ABC transporter substrate-binding protein [Streptomyces sp. Je 1-79]MCT4357591.1 glutamate ABC transporter substrate-binding protein [Streptomyces sp. Je 1-79]
MSGRAALWLLLMASLLTTAPAAAVAAGPSAASRPTAARPPASPPDRAPSCDPRRASPRPARVDGEAVRRIRERGHLVAGVDLNSYLWASLDPGSQQPVGFDVDLVRAIARDILGPKATVRFVSMPPSQRIPRLQARQVDVIVRTMSITCERLADVAFSSVYFETGHRLLVGEGSGIEGFDAKLKGRRVCLSKGSSASALLSSSGTGAVAVETASHLDCLVELQQGSVEAVLTHATLAAGLVAQDPTLRLVGPRLDTSLYGVAMNKDDTDLVRRVNAILEDYREGGARSPWMVSYDRWLAPTLGAQPQGPPKAEYAD